MSNPLSQPSLAFGALVYILQNDLNVFFVLVHAHGDEDMKTVAIIKTWLFINIKHSLVGLKADKMIVNEYFHEKIKYWFIQSTSK